MYLVTKICLDLIELVLLVRAAVPDGALVPAVLVLDGEGALVPVEVWEGTLAGDGLRLKKIRLKH